MRRSRAKPAPIIEPKALRLGARWRVPSAGRAASVPLDVGKVLVKMPPAPSRLVDHGCKPRGLGLEDQCLAVHPRSGVHEDGAPLRRILCLAEPLAIALPGRLVLEQLAYLGEREAGIVAQAANEQQALEVRGVIEAVVTSRAGSRLQQPDLLVIADCSGREARLGRDFVDAEEVGAHRGGWAHGWTFEGHDTTTFTFTLM